MTPSEELTAQAERMAKEVNAKVRGVAKSIAIDPTLNEGVLAMMERSSEMSSPMTSFLAGIAAVPQSRRMWEESLDRLWDRNRVANTLVPEVVIGSGLNAAIYVAIRTQMGFAPPIVLEAEPRAGGIFAASRSATFFLNSRNRPGGLSIPRNQGALNFLPGAVVQPADLSGEEYQVNADLAFAIRSVFALSGAKVVTNARVSRIRPGNRYVRGNRYQREFSVEINLEDGRRLRASRVLVASGIGKPFNQWPTATAEGRLLNFRQFVAMLDQPFPFRGKQRIAVIGSGDSGKTVVEALTGQGPSRHMSVASLDWPSEIVWYGQESFDRVGFESCNRPRYKRLGTLLEENPNRRKRVQPRSQRVSYVDPGYDCVLVDGEPFDMAVNCTGYDPTYSLTDNSPASMNMYFDQARVAPRGTGDLFDRIYYIGPSAQIPRTPQERMATPDAPDFRAQREAEVAAYRYAPRTALFAQRLAVAS